jgi:SAM-dependent methyltransferase
MSNVLHNGALLNCPVCRSHRVSQFLEINGLPVHCNILHKTQDQAHAAATADIHLSFCSECGHIFNRTFNQELLSYGKGYENSLSFSKEFQRYAKTMARQLKEKYHLLNKRIIEIGCGDGQFLIELCELGNNHGIGFDPGLVQSRIAQPVKGTVEFINDYYSEKYADYSADFFCCRQVLEHIDTPARFIAQIRNSAGNRQPKVLFFEVPNAKFIIERMSIWDIIYEHCAYFSPFSVSHLFSSAGFDILSLYEAFDNQFLCIEAAPNKYRKKNNENNDENFKSYADQVQDFPKRFESLILNWRNRIRQNTEKGKSIAVWGGGSKGVTFTNLMNMNKEIACIVDINPYKHGRYIAGTGHKIVAPDYLRKIKPDMIIAMNAVYLDEIAEMVRKIGLQTEMIAA